MQDAVAATKIRAIAFTPVAWTIRAELAKPGGHRLRTLWLRVLSTALIPAESATRLVVGLPTARQSSHGELKISADQQVVVTILTTSPPSRADHSAAKGTYWLLARTFLLHLAGPIAAIWFFARVIDNAVVLALAWVGMFVTPFIPAAWRRFTLNAGRTPIALKQLGDTTIDGFARTPNAAPGQGTTFLVNSVPSSATIHGEAFATLLRTYRNFARQRGDTLHARRIANQWRIGRRRLRPAIYEIRTHPNNIGANRDCLSALCRRRSAPPNDNTPR